MVAQQAGVGFAVGGHVFEFCLNLETGLFHAFDFGYSLAEISGTEIGDGGHPMLVYRLVRRFDPLVALN
jgi:hypothetical protein